MSEYLNYFLTSAIGQHQVFSGEEGISREGLSFEDVAYFIIPSPTLEEQALIIDHLKSKTSNIDVLSRLTTSTIDLLRERRAALIAAAVTGKIKIGADQTPISA